MIESLVPSSRGQLPAAEGSENAAKRLSTQQKYADLLFKVALFSVPFDNLVFAPSKGWATISPFIFLLYVFLNLRKLRDIRFDKYLIAIVTVAMAITGLGWLRCGLSLSTVVDSFGTLLLGVSFYFALRIRYEGVDSAEYNADGNLLIKAYICSFLYGVAWFIIDSVAPGALSFFETIEARAYSRLQFTFTEPSFISMHVFGVLLLYSCLVDDDGVAKRMTVLGLAFVVFTLVANSSGRCTIDIAVFAILLLAKAMFFSSGHVVRNFFLVAASIGLVFALVALSPRFANILSSGFDFNSDPSLASRWFRVQAAFHAFVIDPVGAFFGYGAGNLVVPLHKGYDYAYSLYTNSYKSEVLYLKTVTEVDSLFCGPVKLISDFGFLAAVLFIGYLCKRFLASRLDPFIVVMTFWLYVQFDSYAFYSIWLLLFITREGRFCSSYFQRILDVFSGKTKQRTG